MEGSLAAFPAELSDSLVPIIFYFSVVRLQDPSSLDLACFKLESYAALPSVQCLSSMRRDGFGKGLGALPSPPTT